MCVELREELQRSLPHSPLASHQRLHLSVLPLRALRHGRRRGTPTRRFCVFSLAEFANGVCVAADHRHVRPQLYDHVARLRGLLCGFLALRGLHLRRQRDCVPRQVLQGIFHGHFGDGKSTRRRGSQLRGRRATRSVLHSTVARAWVANEALRGVALRAVVLRQLAGRCPDLRAGKFDSLRQAIEKVGSVSLLVSTAVLLPP